MTTILHAPDAKPPDLFPSHIQAVLVDPSSIPEAATRIAALVLGSSDPGSALFRLWCAFFDAVSDKPSAVVSHQHQTLLALLNAIALQGSIDLDLYSGIRADHGLERFVNADGRFDWATLPEYWEQWRETQDDLEGRRDFNGVRDSDGRLLVGIAAPEPPGAEYLRFSAFSAMQLAEQLAAPPDNGATSAVMWVFFKCREALESARPAAGADSAELPAYRVPPDEVWAVDVRAAAIWLRGGGWGLFKMSNQDAGQHWARALAVETHYWPRKDGLTRDRWRMWAERLWTLSTEVLFDEETRAAAKEAAEIVEGLLKASAES